MIKSVLYNFEIIGDFDTINYYRSLTPMNTESMPAPTVNGITETIYRDKTVDPEITYYVRFGSVYEGEEKISDEIIVKTFNKLWESSEIVIDYFLNNSNLYGGTTATASLETFGLDLTGDVKWRGAVIGPDNKIYCIPHQAPDILIIDPETGTATRTDFGLNLIDDYKWMGAALGPDGKIYCAPYNSPDILIIDPVNGTAIRNNFGLDLATNFKYSGIVLGKNDLLYCIPYSATNGILVIDPMTNSAIVKSYGLDLNSTFKFRSASINKNGIIHAASYNHNDTLFINTNIDTSWIGALGNSGTWAGSVLGPNNKIYNIPFTSTNVYTADENYNLSMIVLSITGSSKWSGGALGPDGKIYCIPHNSVNFLIIDPMKDTAALSNLGITMSETNKFDGAILGPDNKIYCIPYSAPYIAVISFDPSIPLVSDQIVRSPHYNKY